MTLICVDLGATNIRAGLADDLPAPRFSTSTPATADLIVERIAEAVAEISMGLGDAPNHVAVGCPGLVDVDGTIRAALHVPLAGRKLAVELRAEIGAPVTVMNDAQAQAVGCVNESTQSLFYIALGTGVGGAIIDGGKLVSGRDGFAGEVGHIPLGVSRLECGCGAVGCLDTTASGIALQRQLGADWYWNPLTSTMEKVLRSAGSDVGRAAALGAILLNPAAVVLAGRLLTYDTFRSGVLESWQDRAWGDAELRMETDTWPLALRGLTRMAQ